jgi:hypothetical protein
MFFYGAAFLMLYSALRAPGSLRARTCSNGHQVSSSDRLCPICGESLRA